jgi:hypothetical protein
MPIWHLHGSNGYRSNLLSRSIGLLLPRNAGYIFNIVFHMLMFHMQHHMAVESGLHYGFWGPCNVSPCRPHELHYTYRPLAGLPKTCSVVLDRMMRGRKQDKIHPGSDTHSGDMNGKTELAPGAGIQTGTSAKPLRHCPSAAIGRQRFAAGSYTCTQLIDWVYSS